MPKTVNPDPDWTDTLEVPLPHETMDSADVAVPDTRLLANDKWLKKEFGARLDALERAVWPTSIQAELTASEADPATHIWRFEYSLSTNRGSISTATLDFGDGSPVVTLSNPAAPGFVTHDYPDTGGSYTAVLNVQASEGASQRVEQIITVSGTAMPDPEPTPTELLAPLLDLQASEFEGEYYIAKAGYDSPPSSDLSVTLTLDWGDGSPVQQFSAQAPLSSSMTRQPGEAPQYSLAHIYNPGSYTARITATDDLGRTQSATQQITVATTAITPSNYRAGIPGYSGTLVGQFRSTGAAPTDVILPNTGFYKQLAANASPLATGQLASALVEQVSGLGASEQVSTVSAASGVMLLSYDGAEGTAYYVTQLTWAGNPRLLDVSGFWAAIPAEADGDAAPDLRFAPRIIFTNTANELPTDPYATTGNDFDYAVYPQMHQCAPTYVGDTRWQVPTQWYFEDSIRIPKGAVTANIIRPFGGVHEPLNGMHRGLILTQLKLR